MWMRIADFVREQSQKGYQVELLPERGEVIVRHPDGSVAHKVLADFKAGVVYGI